MCIDLGLFDFNLCRLDYAKIALSNNKEREELVRKDCNTFLKTREGLSYLCMKYPNLLVLQAIDEYIKNALWIDSIVV